MSSHVSGIGSALTGRKFRPILAHGVVVHAGNHCYGGGGGGGGGGKRLAFDAPSAPGAGVSTEVTGPSVQGTKAIIDSFFTARRAKLDRRACRACCKAIGFDAAGIA